MRATKFIVQDWSTMSWLLVAAGDQGKAIAIIALGRKVSPPRHNIDLLLGNCSTLCTHHRSSNASYLAIGPFRALQALSAATASLTEKSSIIIVIIIIIIIIIIAVGEYSRSLSRPKSRISPTFDHPHDSLL